MPPAALDEFNRAISEHGRPCIDVGIGINTSSLLETGSQSIE